MKKLQLLFCFVLSIILLSCSTEPDKRSNELIFQGVSYPLTDGILQEFGEKSNGVFDWDVRLIGESLSYDANTNSYLGSGPRIYFDLNSDFSEGLSTGNYIFDPGPREAFTMVAGNLDKNFNSAGANETTVIISGNVDVVVGDLETSFEFSFRDNQGNSITGYYSGTLQEI